MEQISLVREVDRILKLQRKYSVLYVDQVGVDETSPDNINKSQKSKYDLAKDVPSEGLGSGTNQNHSATILCFS